MKNIKTDSFTKALSLPFRLTANVIKGFIKFVIESFKELRLVTWLSPKDTLKFTMYVLLFIIASASLIALLDFTFTKAVTYITTYQR